jgi:hypothetical protein
MILAADMSHEAAILIHNHMQQHIICIAEKTVIRDDFKRWILHAMTDV